MPRPFAILCLIALATSAAVADDGCDLAVRVFMENGAEAPAGVMVRMTAADGTQVQGATSNDGSGARFEQVPCGGWQVEVGSYRSLWGMDRSRVWARAVVEATPGVVAEAVVTVPTVRALTVRADDLDGIAVPGGFVVAWYVSGSDGVFRSGESFVLGPDGSGTAFLTAGRYQVRYRPAPPREIVETDVDGRAAEEQPVFDLADADVVVRYRVTTASTVSGVIRDESGAGVEGVFVETLNSEGGPDCVRCWTTAADGSFRADVREFPARVQPSDDTGAWSFEPADLFVDSESESQGLFFVAVPRTEGRLRGSIVSRRDGSPIGEASVWTHPRCPDDVELQRSWMTTLQAEPDGTFETVCPDPACDVEVSVYPPEDTRYLGTKWVGSTDGCTADIRIELDVGATIRGVVTGPRQRPAENLPLRLHAEGKRVRTDDGGRFVFDRMTPGTYEIEVDPAEADDDRRDWVLVPSWGEQDSPPPLSEVTLDGSGVEEELDLVVLEGGRLCVTIRDEDGRATVVDRVQAYVPGEDRPRTRTTTNRSELRDEPDTICAGPLPPGLYEVEIGRDSGRFMPTWWPGEEDRTFATPVEVEAGKTADVGPLTVRPAGGGYLEVPGVDLERDGMYLVDLLPVPDEDDADDPDRIEPSWEPLPEERVKLIVRSRRGQDENGEDETVERHTRVRLLPVPAGSWDVRLCDTDCDRGTVWCSEAPLTIRTGESSSEAVMQRDDPWCAPLPEEEP